jgi:GntR family transcriptional regulator, transcriptional repressor for pyruvate dehydrogenase complex
MSIPLLRVTATKAIVESLKERIRNGEFGPGDQLPSEQVMLQEYSVSRLTLREALARLAALGIIHVRHGKGAFVTKSISVSALDNVLIPLFPNHDFNRMNDLVEARNLIESEVAAKVSKTRTADQIALLEELLKYDENILGDPELFARRDYDFHFALVEISGNQFFIAMYQALFRHIQAFLIRYARSIEDRAEALERHRPILKAIIDKDVELARKLAREHATICASFISKKGIAGGSI